mgnify:CR=1 FL=1
MRSIHKAKEETIRHAPRTSRWRHLHPERPKPTAGGRRSGRVIPRSDATPGVFWAANKNRQVSRGAIDALNRHGLRSAHPLPLCGHSAAGGAGSNRSAGPLTPPGAKQKEPVYCILVPRPGRGPAVAADAYKLPFVAGAFDGVTMIRVIHHMAHVDAVLKQVRRVLTSGGTFVLEHANKRNLKSIVRYALKKQTWNPHDLAPVEFVELNFDFHPEYILRELKAAQFDVRTRIPVSFFRLNALKNAVPTGVLAGLDGLLQTTGVLLSPSVFVKSAAVGDSPDNLKASTIFACPECGGPLTPQRDAVLCQREGLRWAVRDGIYDFKAPLENDL